jgi:hypothetical protein
MWGGAHNQPSYMKYAPACSGVRLGRHPSNTSNYRKVALNKIQKIFKTQKLITSINSCYGGKTMINWFNSLDTKRRIFILAVSAFYIIFFYMYLGEILHFFNLYFFHNKAFTYQMGQTKLAQDAAAMGVSFNAPLGAALSAFKWLGASTVVVAGLSYAIFRKKSNN